MDLTTRKYNFIQELTKMDENLLTKLEFFLEANKKDWANELSETEQKEIEIGLEQAKNNEFVDHETIMNKFAKWLSK